LQSLDFGVKHGSQFAGVKIATFEEVLAKFARHAIINLHLKSVDENGTYPEDQMRKIVALLTKYDQMEHVYFMGSSDVMACALKIAPQIPRCMASFPEPEKILERAAKYQCSKVQFFSTELKDGQIEKAHQMGLKCNLFFCDDPELAPKYLADGIDTILTNDCLHILPLIKQNF
jgi:glycerophosphoryl diester phosphodiesterase